MTVRDIVPIFESTRPSFAWKVKLLEPLKLEFGVNVKVQPDQRVRVPLFAGVSMIYVRVLCSRSLPESVPVKTVSSLSE